MNRAALLLLALTLVLLIPAAAAASESTADQYVNSSEPEFLRDIGPRDPRVDNPLAAGITAIVVAAVIIRGVLAYRKRHPDGG